MGCNQSTWPLERRTRPFRVGDPRIALAQCHRSGRSFDDAHRLSFALAKSPNDDECQNDQVAHGEAQHVYKLASICQTMSLKISNSAASNRWLSGASNSGRNFGRSRIPSSNSTIAHASAAIASSGAGDFHLGTARVPSIHASSHMPWTTVPIWLIQIIGPILPRPAKNALTAATINIGKVANAERQQHEPAAAHGRGSNEITPIGTYPAK